MEQLFVKIGGVETPVKLTTNMGGVETPLVRMDGIKRTPPAFRAVTKLDYATGRTTSTVSAPSSTVDDYVILFLLQEDGSITPTSIPSGFTAIAGPVQYAPSGNGVNSYAWIYTKFVGASEPSTYSFTHVSSASEISALAYSGVSKTTPFDVAFSQAQTIGTTQTAPSITTTNPNTLLVYLGGTWSGWNENSAPLGFTTRDWLSGRGLNQSDAVQNFKGATGSKSASTSTNGGNGGVAFLLALRSALLP